MRDNEFECPDCGWHNFPNLVEAANRKMVEIIDIDCLNGNADTISWTERWTCPDCGKVFEVKNANY